MTFDYVVSKFVSRGKCIIVTWPPDGAKTFINPSTKRVLGQRKPEREFRICRRPECEEKTKNLAYCCRHCLNLHRPERKRKAEFNQREA